MNFGYANYKDFLKVLVEMLKNKVGDGLLTLTLYGSVARGKAKAESEENYL